MDLLAKLNPPPTTLAEARADPHGVVALDGGGIMIFLTCPAGMVACDEPALFDLLADLHALRFDDAQGSGIAFHRLSAPDTIRCDCYCCFGHYTGDLWLHRYFDPFDIEPAVREVLRGRAPRIPWSTETLLKRAQAAEPETTRWPKRLLSLYTQRMKPLSDEARIATAALALAECQSIGRIDPRDFPTVAAEVAFDAGAYATADAYARGLLRDAWRRIGTSSNYYARSHGRHVHQAHTILGRIALRAGDTAAAEAHLIESARAPLVLQDVDECPDFTLAAELLAAGERRALPRFLALCRFLWKEGGDRLSRWTDELRSGGSPSFTPA